MLVGFWDEVATPSCLTVMKVIITGVIVGPVFDVIVTPFNVRVVVASVGGACVVALAL
jgi:hypothetical protein